MARTTKTSKTAKPAAKPTIISRSEPKEIRNLPNDVRERIRARAYELWEQRGCQHGNPEEDWLRAEQEIAGGRAEQTA
jgi:hypothetical protein